MSEATTKDDFLRISEASLEGSSGQTTEAPLRSDILSREALIQLAANLATEQTVSFFHRQAKSIYPRFEENARILEKTYFILAEAAKDKQPLTPGGEWLLDNYHLVQQQIREIRKLLPRGYYKRLPILTTHSSALPVSTRGIPRVYALALTVVSHTDAVIEEDLLSAFITSYQSKQILSSGELWAIPIMLRLALIENLRRLSSLTLEARDAEQRISAMIDTVLAGDDKTGTTILLDLASIMKQEGEELSHAASAHLIRQLRAYGPQATLALNWFEQWLSEKGFAEKGTHIEELLREESLTKAANQISIGNSFTSLKTILSLDWLEWFEKNSAVDAILRQDPSGMYNRCDFRTRNRYRSKIEQLARQTRRPEVEVAENLLSFIEKRSKQIHSTQTESEDTIRPLLHVGYYLIDRGAAPFEETLGVHSRKWLRALGAFRKESSRFPLYLSTIGAVTILIILAALAKLPSSEISIWTYSVTALLLLLPASDLAINIIHWLAAHLLPPAELPKLDFSAGVPDEYKTVVAVHSILRDPETIAKAVDFLEVRFLANIDSNISFALLADLPDADQETTPNDNLLIESVTSRMRDLSARYSQSSFFLLTRKRVWNSSQRRFISWEKKRGKVMEFNRLLLGSHETSFTLQASDEQVFARIKYVITLDADTSLPHGAAKRLIATIAHPLNAAKFDISEETSANVVSEGYGIIQPRLAVTLPSAQATLFAKVFGGDVGVDPYTLAVSDIYQDLFHEGSFYGKGIYEVQSFERALEGRVPESTLLSHDLFEGIFARVGLATDIELYDEFPRTYTAFATRQHRWVRGDWQLLPWLYPKVPTETSGIKVASSISPLGYWKLLDNLRRSLIAPACLILLAFAWALLPGSPLWWTLLVLIVIAFPVFAHLATAVVTSPLGMSLSGYVRDFSRELKNNCLQAILTFSFLPYQAWLMSHAIVITLFRLYVSRKNLLDWETAYQAERRLGTHLTAFVRQMAPACIMVLLIALFITAVSPLQLLPITPVLLFWFCSPIFAWWISNPISPSVQPLNETQRNSLQEIAQQTWTFFDHLMTEETNYLVPDNLQLFPRRVIAYRTSPSNIGLSYLSILSAADLGFITPLAAATKLAKSLETLKRLERRNGHFYNWYDIHSLKPLEPRYISTVDSGNLIGHLIAVKNGMRELLSQPHPQLTELEDRERVRLLSFISDTCETIIKETDFRFLYNHQRKLFAIGYQVSEGKFDNSFYDLLASEARLTSLLAIAKGDVPLEHWFVLGRPLTRALGGKALLSWSGTMFEYLMPLLVTKTFPNTILHETYKAIVQTQRIYAGKRGIPWGISESGYAGVDFEHTYQYRAFGVPGLGLKRGLSDDFVVSPYSTFLAMMVAPQDALKNLVALEHAGLRGEYGFYESIDFTPERLSREETGHIVKSFLAHHQGMTLLALNNVLNDNILQQRFHQDPLVRAVEPLLQEKFPQRTPLTVPHHSELTYVEQREEGLAERWSEVINTPHTALPRTRVLSNGFYSLLIDNTGSGFSFIPGVMLSRWREDALRNNCGSYVFVKDLDTNKIWSTTYQPSRQQPEFYEVIFNPDKVEFKRRDFGIALHTEITVSPEDNVEIRKITVTNLSRKVRNLQFTSFAEIAFNATEADAIHPAYSKMFVESEFVSDTEALVFTRRPRSVDESRNFLLTMLSMPAVWDKTEYETSREAFLGRGRDIHNSQVFDRNHLHLRGTVGTVLDPITSFRTRVEVGPSSSETLSFITAVGKSREEVLFLAERYNGSRSITRAFEMAWSKSNIEFRTEQLSIRQSHLNQHLANALFFQHKMLRSEPQIISQNRLQQSGLWRLSISGDLPIVLVSISDHSHLKLLQELLKAHDYLRNRSVLFDLVIINEHSDGYFQNVTMGVEQLIRSIYPPPVLESKGGVFVRTLKQISPEEYLLLKTVAKAVFVGEKGSLGEQLELPGELEEVKGSRRGPLDELWNEENVPSKAELKKARVSREYDNGFGGFIENGKAYALTVQSEKLTPSPWINVIANPNFGFTVSETGSGYTWSENSRENRLTPWSNDSVSDPPGEVIYIRDGNTGAFWCPTPLPVRNRGTYNVEHHRGFSSFKSTVSNIQSELTLSGSLSERVKWWYLKLQNNDIRRRRLEIFLYIEWILGVLRSQSLPHLVTFYDSKIGMLAAQNFYNNEFAGRTVFLGSNVIISSYTTSRTEFIGQNHTLSSPRILENAVTAPGLVSLAGMANLSRLVELSRKTGAGHDSCGALKVVASLEPAEEIEILFFMGEAATLAEAREATKTYRKTSYRKSELQSVRTYWDSLSSTIEVKTPDRTFDIMLNSWLMYQCLSSRIFGRTGFYQSGGAFGFRDQLQDGLSILYTKPEVTRELILGAAARQFLEGDVQHWWHPPTGRGVRTRISDDYLWLPYVVEKYLEITGDWDILEAQVPFIEAPLLDPAQMDAYLQPHISAKKDSLYTHCLLALHHGLKFGQHGLPLIGAGDWNDGFNEIGREGKGESVWLGWFLLDNLNKWAKITESRQEDAQANTFRTHALQLQASLEEHAWDGNWYRRAFFDDGTPLGSEANEECQIDSIAQTWAVISRGGDPARSRRAFSSLLTKLVNEEDKLILLLTPPFDKSPLNPGYLKGYPPGVRENGAQYSHAAAWSVIAASMLGMGNTAHHLFSMMNPLNHTMDKASVDRYRGEPYVLSGDVYSKSPYTGRAGWSWYTGSCGWLYQAGLSYMLGFKLHGSYFTMEPCIPSHWKSYGFRYRHQGSLYVVEVKNPNGVESGVLRTELDGVEVVNGQIPLDDSSPREQQVSVLMG